MLDARWAEREGGATGAALDLAHVRHPNASLVEPLMLGEACQGLSGLYAAINGIRLALAHKHQLTAPEVHVLMRAGLRFLDGRLSLQQCVLNGLRVQHWRGLVEAIAEATGQRLGLRVSVERIHVADARRRYEAFGALDIAVRAWRIPLILCRGGAYRVVSGTTAASVLLFDSDACWLAKRVCGVPGDGDGLRHILYPTAFLALNA